MLDPANKHRLIEIASEQAFNAILITDANLADGGPFIVYCNPAFCRLTGYAKEELIGASPRLLQGEKTDPAVIASLREALQQGTFWEGRAVNYRKDGTPYIVNWNISPVFGEQGRLSHFVSVQQDVTAHEEAAREREMLIQALNQAHDPVLVTDRNSRIVFVNRAFEQLTGYQSAEVLGQTPGLLSSGEQPAAFYQKMWQRLENNQPFQSRFINQRKDGSRYYVEQSIAPVVDAEGQCTHYISTSWKVDDLVKREKHLQAMASEDKLTGLLTRRAGDEQLQQAYHQLLTDEQPLSLIICDIDHFKTVNDRFGHLSGDRIIQQFAQALSQQLRATDTAVRWGGEEFLIIARARLDESIALAERLRKAVTSIHDSEVGNVSASFGVSEVQTHDTLMDALERADNALYAAKQGGRNRVCSH